jgi:hypothetical protein
MPEKRPRGRPPDRAQRERVAELRRQGLTIAEIARRVGTTHQAVSQLLAAQRVTATFNVLCSRCNAVIGQMSAVASAVNRGKVLCLACLERTPEATLGQRLRSFRVARGLT